MYARVTTFQSDLSRIDEMNEIRESMKADIAAVAGLTIAIAAWNDDGSGSVTAVYESQEAAEAAQDQIAGIWGKMADLLTAPPAVTGYTNVDNMLS